jgi:uncharacterized protein (DUF1501 family)
MAQSQAFGHHLIVLFLRGGADGLSLVPSLGESRYFDLRPQLAIAESDALILDSFYGLHPSAGALKTLFDASDLAIVHACGLPTAERSHFEAQAIMELGIDAGEVSSGDGWLARYLTTLNDGMPLAAVALDHATPMSMAGLDSALAIGQIDGFNLSLDGNSRDVFEALYRLDPLLHPTAESVFRAVDALGPVQQATPGSGYPDTGLGVSLADAARLIKSGVGLHAAAINTGGWDTHEGQIEEFGGLVSNLGEALLAFRNDLGLYWQDTTVVVQTEFGRRVAQNASGGTDHGHGGVMLVAGGRVNGGQVVGDWPGLHESALSDGQDLAVTVDYRQVIAEVLTSAFGVVDFAPVFGDWHPGPWHGLLRSDTDAKAFVPLAGPPASKATLPTNWQVPGRLSWKGLGPLPSEPIGLRSRQRGAATSSPHR